MNATPDTRERAKQFAVREERRNTQSVKMESAIDRLLAEVGKHEVETAKRETETTKLLASMKEEVAKRDAEAAKRDTETARRETRLIGILIGLFAVGTTILGLMIRNLP